MFCCLGLVAGFTAGAALGGPWTLIAPIAGFGLGLIGDLTMIRHGLNGIRKSAERSLNMRENGFRPEEAKEV